MANKVAHSDELMVVQAGVEPPISSVHVGYMSYLTGEFNVS